LGIAEDEWVLLVKTLGGIKDIQNLTLYCRAGSRDFHPFQALADAVKNAQSLCKLAILLDGETFPRDSSGLAALARALREHKALEEFEWVDICSRMEAAQSTASDPVDPVLRALPACPYLRKVVIQIRFASAGTMKNLLQLRQATKLHLVLETDQWLAVADEIRRGRCNVQRLTLGMVRGATLDATEAVKAVASAIQLDRNLEYLYLQIENGFTDEAGVALAEALTVNATLRMITVSVINPSPNTHALGVQSYEAFTDMLRINTSLVMELLPFEIDGGDERLDDSYNQMRIEQRLNKVGRGRLLASRQTPREDYVDALNELNSYHVDDSPAFQVSCLYSLLGLHPAVCMS
jgi:hypothetical protein